MEFIRVVRFLALIATVSASPWYDETTTVGYSTRIAKRSLDWYAASTILPPSSRIAKRSAFIDPNIVESTTIPAPGRMAKRAVPVNFFGSSTTLPSSRIAKREVPFEFYAVTTPMPGSSRIAKRAAPLDVNAELSSTLATLSSLVDVLGHSASTTVMGLTGISITDCAGQLPADVNSLPCDQFLDALSQCDSLANVKPYLQKAKKANKAKPNKKAPCSKNKKSKPKTKKH